MNYNMMNQDNTIGELMSTLREAENELLKGKKHGAHFASTSQSSRAWPKATEGVKKKKKKGKAKSSKPSGKGKDKSQDVCLQCGKRGHWKRDCREYKAHMKEIKADKAPASGMFVIEINPSATSFKIWIFDSGCVTHICTDVQDLRISRRLAS